MKNIFSIFVVLVLILIVGGCTTQRRCLQKYPPQVVTEHTREVVIRDSIIKGAIITDTLIIKELEKMPIYQYVYKYDTSGKAMMRFYKDAYGRIIAECQSKDQMVQQIRETIKDTEKQVIVKVEKVKVFPWYLFVVIGILVSAVGYLLIKNLF